MVCPPGLNITLGIFYRLWCLLEAGCHELDIELAIHTSPNPTDQESFKRYSSLVKEHTRLREKELDMETLHSSLNQTLIDIAINSTSESHPPFLPQVQ